MKDVKIMRWINFAAFVCMATVNALAEIIPIAGMTTGEISALYPSPLTPASWAFAIWGVIYAYIAVFLVIQFLAHDKYAVTEKLGWWFVISCAANALWVIMWHMKLMSAALIMMAVLLVSLVILEGRFRYTKDSLRESLLVRGPFSLYFGWITVAAIANVSVWLVSMGFEGLGIPKLLEALVLLAGGAIVCAGIWVNSDYVYALAGVWAYTGILFGNVTSDAGARLGAALITGVCMAAFVAVSVLRAYINCDNTFGKMIGEDDKNDM